jgi:hypothetical protein
MGDPSICDSCGLRLCFCPVPVDDSTPCYQSGDELGEPWVSWLCSTCDGCLGSCGPQSEYDED